MYKVSEELKSINLRDVGQSAFLDWDMLEDEVRDELIAEGYDSSSPVCKSLIDRHGLWDIAGDYEYDDDVILWELEGVIKNAPHYLVMAHNCRWNGASGYRFVHEIEDAFYRDYDSSIYPVSVSRGGKCLVCRESSHDVPMGAITSIIALTEEEYIRLSGWNADWDTVEAFVRQCERKAVAA